MPTVKKMKMKLFPIQIYKRVFYKGYRYLRLRKAPYLTAYDKIQRLVWCLNNRETDFSRYIFIDETMIKINEVPPYHIRLRSSRPQAIPCTTKYSIKLNVCGGISVKGLTEFAVIIVVN